MSLSPDEEAALCRESGRLKEAAVRRLDCETVAFGFARERKALRRERRVARRVARRGGSPTGRRSPDRPGRIVGLDRHADGMGTVDGEWTVDRHLEGLPAESIALYDRFIELATACGPFTYSVAKSAITLKGSRRGFAGVKPRPQRLDGYLDLQRQVEDPRIRRAEPYTRRLFVHQFRVTSVDQLDDTFAGWLAEAYAVGAGGHLQAPPPHR